MSLPNKQHLKTVWQLAWPTMLEEFMGTSVSYADMFMVGSLGTLATAAVGATSTVSWLVYGTVDALGVGFLSYISRALGAGQTEKARRAAAQSVLAALCAGILFTVLTFSVSGVLPKWMQTAEEVQPAASRYFFIFYSSMLFRAAVIIFSAVLRAAGDTRTPMRIGVGVNLINVLLNFFLIYDTRIVNMFGLSFTCPGAGLGVDGAAAASAISFVFGGVLTAICLYKHKVISPKGVSLRPDATVLKPCLHVALPNMAQRFCTSSGYVIFSSLINGLGTVATAAHTVANTVESMFYIPAYGMQAAAAALTGHAIGEKRPDKLKEQDNSFLFLEVLLMSFTGALLFIFAPQLAGLFSKDEKVIRLGALVLRMVAVSEPFYGISVATEGMLQGAGLTAKPFLFNTVSMWAVRNLGTFLVTRMLGVGLAGAWACMIAGNLLLMTHFRLYFGKVRPTLCQKTV